MPGTSFVVDHFGRKVEEVANCCSWFLTHFHADHYMGLNGRFKSGKTCHTQHDPTKYRGRFCARHHLQTKSRVHYIRGPEMVFS